MKRILALLSISMIGFTQLHSQSLQSLTPSMPTSPQSEAFQRYGEYSVNYSTGVPDISVPLYEINHHGYKMPLQLRYNPQPVKPYNNYDVYGHGWGMSLSSSVSRSIEGSPDEWTDFKLVTSNYSQYYFIPPASAIACDDIYGCDRANVSHVNLFNMILIHDKFNVVLPNGSSFGFVLDYGANHKPIAKISDGRQVQISVDYNSQNILGFTIIDEEGVKYTFDGADLPGPYPGTFTGFVSWHLTAIELTNTDEPIYFNYDHTLVSPPFTNYQEPGIALTDNYDDGQSSWRDYERYTYATDAPTTTHYTYTMKLLSSITYGSNTIMFNYKHENYGSNLPTHNYATSIQINGIRHIKLDMTEHAVTGRFAFTLAKLDSISIRGSNINGAPQLYRFTYQGLAGSFGGTDHWGYVNEFDTEHNVGNFNLFIEANPSYTSNFSPYASMLTKTSQDINPYYKMKISNSNFDNRQPGGNHGVLASIRYPTGGYTDFEFESHRFLTSTDYDGNYILNPINRREATAAGFRIRKISNYAKDGVRSDVKNYRYGKRNVEAYLPGHPNYSYAVNSPNAHTGLGIAPADPNVLTYMNYTWDFHGYNADFVRNMILGLDQYGDYTIFGNYFNGSLSWNNWRWEAYFSAGNFRKVLDGRPPVLYSDVTVYYGDIDEGYSYTPENTIGKTVYSYNITQSGTDLTGRAQDDVFIEAPRYVRNVIVYTPASYSLNKISKKVDYKFDGSIYKPVKKEEYDWAASTESYYDDIHTPFKPASTIDHYAYVSDFFAQEQRVIGVALLMDKATTIYDPQGIELTSHEYYDYNNSKQVSSIGFQNSDGKMVRKTFSYPKDKTGTIVQKLIDKNIISPVLEMQTTSAEGLQTPIVTSGAKVDYNEFTIGTKNILMPAKSYQLEITPSTSSYTLQSEVKSYSSDGNPLEYISKDGLTSSFIWGYDGRYMIAEAKNAPLADIAYSSFEDGSKGNWTYTGILSSSSPSVPFIINGFTYYNLTPSTALSKTVINGKTYMVSYWSTLGSAYTITGGTGTVKTGAILNGWTHFEHSITASGTTLTLSGTGGLDEVRLYPAGALMTTYTYRPLIGVTSVTDPNNKTNYYEYDAAGRLSLIRDQDNNIVKKYCYNYAGQPEECSVFTSTNQSGNFFSQNCGSQTPLAYYVSIPQGMFTSTISVADANAQAQQYGQAQANLYGSCSAPLTPVYTSNNTSNTYYLTFWNNTTGLSYNYTIYPWSGPSANIPIGNYTVTVSDSGSGSDALINVLGYSTFGMFQYVSDISITSGSNYIYMSY